MSTRIRYALAASMLMMASISVAAELPSSMPKRRPGLWEMQMSTNKGAAPNLPRECSDETTNLDVEAKIAKHGANCSKWDFRANGSDLVLDSVCQQGEVTVTNHTEMHFDGDTAYTQTSHLHYQPAMFGDTVGDLKITSRWVGRCAAGQKGGDMIDAHGKVIGNIKD
jgi:hypothetical protein